MVGLIELNVPPKDIDNLWKRMGPVDQVEKSVIFAKYVQEEEISIRFQSAFARAIDLA